MLLWQQRLEWRQQLLLLRVLQRRQQRLRVQLLQLQLQLQSHSLLLIPYSIPKKAGRPGHLPGAPRLSWRKGSDIPVFKLLHNFLHTMGSCPLVLPPVYGMLARGFLAV